MRRVGRASFSVYLVHLPLIGIAAGSVAARIGVPAAVLGALAATAAATLVVELAIVRPAAQLGRTWSARIASNYGSIRSSPLKDRLMSMCQQRFSCRDDTRDSTAEIRIRVDSTNLNGMYSQWRNLAYFEFDPPNGHRASTWCP
jgi:hypothetical protein